MSSKRRGGWPWIGSLLFFGAGCGLGLLLSSRLESAKFLTFYPAVAASALIGGWPQGVMVLCLSALAAWYFFFEPFSSFAVKDSDAVVALTGFLLVGGFDVLLVAGLRELVRRLDEGKRVQQQLFGELQHRVANNLQIVVALLNDAKRKLRHSKEAAEEAIGEAEDRIHAMSQLHRRFYDGTLSASGLTQILREAAAETFRDHPVEVRLDIAEADMSIDQMTAVVLLVNEAAINAAKHAFSRGRGTLFEVSLSKDAAGCFQLVVRDDGPGIDPAADAERSGSLGMGIMRAFASQLGGSLEVTGAPGTTLSVKFSPR